MPPIRSKLRFTNEDSKAIATITTIFSALIFKFPEGNLKEFLLIIVGFIGYLFYHLFVFFRNLTINEVTKWISLVFMEFRVKKYITELEEEKKLADLSPERSLEICAEIRSFREILIKKRLDNLR